MEFNYVRLRLTIATEQPHVLLRRLYGSAADFSVAFRNRACSARNGVCARCRECQTCAYHTVFGQQLTPDPVALKRFQKPPLPFVFTFPPEADQSDSLLCCEIVLVGSAINHLFLFVDAFQEMLTHFVDAAQEDAPQVVRIESLDYDNNALVLSIDNQRVKQGDVAVLDAGDLFHSAHSMPETIRITLVTPLRLVSNGKVQRDFDVSRFLRTLLRRVSAMAYYYCGWEMAADFRRCTDGAGEVVPHSVHFRHAAAHDQFVASGVIGAGVFRGCPDDLWPFLLMGELLHVGKGASFGMGRFTVVGAGEEK